MQHKEVHDSIDVVKSMREKRVYERNGIEDEQRYCVVLIAEDCMINMILLSTIVSRFLPHARIIKVRDGKRAVQAFGEEKPDIVFMDVQMPEMDGYDAARAIRQIGTNTQDHIPIIALTASSAHGERERCQSAGMDEYLAKPVTEGTIHCLLRRCLFRHDVCLPETASIEKTDEVHINIEELLDSIDGNGEMASRLMKMAIRSLSLLFINIKAASAANNVEQVRQDIHRMKGSALNIGFLMLGKIAKDFEEMIETKNEISVQLLDTMETEICYLEQEILGDEKRCLDIVDISS
jgi:CheY-like chemotaxis protein/HPt (histidine-containing phosphotransfer) domain-containing protein